MTKATKINSILAVIIMPLSLLYLSGCSFNTDISLKDSDSGIDNELHVNHPPTTASDLSFSERNKLTITNSVNLNVLANDSDPDGDTLSVSSKTDGSHGTVVIEANQTLTYTPEVGFIGEDAFTYTVDDGKGLSKTETVTVNVLSPYTWTGATASKKWSDQYNWCGTISSNGCASDGLPPPNDNSEVAYFNDQCPDCEVEIDSSINVLGIKSSSGFNGTLTQLSGQTITLGKSGLNWDAGIFEGSDSPLTMQYFEQKGGTVNLPNAETKIISSVYNEVIFSFQGGTFNQPSGTLVFSGNYSLTASYSIDLASDLTIANLVFDHSFSNVNGYASFSLPNSSFIVTNDLSFTATGGGKSNLGNGLVQVKGDIYSTAESAGGNGWVELNGTTDQHYNASGSGTFPSLRINKSLGQVLPNGGIVELNLARFSLQSGTFTAPLSGKVTAIDPSYGTTAFEVVDGTTYIHNNSELEIGTAYSLSSNNNISVPNNFTVYDLTLSYRSAGTSNHSLSIASGDFIVNNFSCKNSGGGGNISILSSQISASGDLYTETGCIGGTTAIHSVGGTDSTYQVGGLGGEFPPLVVNKTAAVLETHATTTDASVETLDVQNGTFRAPTGDLVIGNSRGLANTFVVSSTGVFDHNSGHVSFNYDGGSSNHTLTLDVNGSQNFNDLTFTDSTTRATTYELASGDLLNVYGTLTLDSFDSSNPPKINNETIKLFGNLDVKGSFAGGTTELVFDGSATVSQSIAQTSDSHLPGTILTLINSSNLYLSSNLDLENTGHNFDLQNGSLNLNGYDLLNLDVFNIAASGVSVDQDPGRLTYNTCPGPGSCPRLDSTPSPFTWMGTAGDDDWTNAANWCGTLDLGVCQYDIGPPDSTQLAYFNSECTDCDLTLAVDPNVGGIRLMSSFTGTITQNSGQNITIGGSGFIISGGNFHGTTGNIDINSGLEIMGGHFRSTANTLEVGRVNSCATITIFKTSDSSYFDHNSGNVLFVHSRSGSCHSTAEMDIVSGTTFNNLEINTSSPGAGWYAYYNQLSANPFEVSGDFKHYGGRINSDVNVYGDLYVGGGADTSEYQFKFVGTGDQEYHHENDRYTAWVVIDKASGNVAPAVGTNSLFMTGFNLIQGSFTAPATNMNVGQRSCGSDTGFRVGPGTTFDISSAHIKLERYRYNSCNNTQTIEVPVSFVFNSLEIFSISPHDGWYQYYESPNGPIKVAGDLTVGPTALNFDVEVGGNVILDSYGGSGAITFNGTSEQTFDWPATHNLPSGSITINNAAGVRLLSDITFASSNAVTLSSGGVDMAGFDFLSVGDLSLQPGTSITKSGGQLGYTSCLGPAACPSDDF